MNNSERLRTWEGGADHFFGMMTNFSQPLIETAVLKMKKDCEIDCVFRTQYP